MTESHPSFPVQFASADSLGWWLDKPMGQKTIVGMSAYISTSLTFRWSSWSTGKAQEFSQTWRGGQTCAQGFPSLAIDLVNSSSSHKSDPQNPLLFRVFLEISRLITVPCSMLSQQFIPLSIQHLAYYVWVPMSVPPARLHTPYGWSHDA